MASIIASTCWPTRFAAKWLALFFGATVFGLVLGALAYPRISTALVQVNLQAYEIYSDGTRALVPAHVITAGRGEVPVAESDQGATSTDPKKPLLISREPGTKQWLIFQWAGTNTPRRINPWPKSAIPYIVEFHLNRPSPHTVRPKTAH